MALYLKCEGEIFGFFKCEFVMHICFVADSAEIHLPILFGGYAHDLFKGVREIGRLLYFPNVVKGIVRCGGLF